MKDKTGTFHADHAFALPAAGCLALLWPALPHTMIDAPMRSNLERVAAKLPPIPRLALEVRLADGGNKVDLHQLLTRHDGDPAILARHLDRVRQDAQRAPQLVHFLRQWADNVDGLRDQIEHIFLEWDEPTDGKLPAAPAVFLPIDERASLSAPRAKRRELLRRLITVLQRAGRSPSLPSALESIWAVARGNISVSHIGVMLGRADVLRVNCRGIRGDQFAGFLRSIGWPGDTRAAREYFEALLDLADRVTVAFDVTTSVMPSIGFEAALDGDPPQEPRWRRLFDYLCALDLCAPNKRDALLGFNRLLRPEHKDQGWPASWLVATALASTACTPSFSRRLPHIKVALAADGTVAAKAYLAGQHFWSDRPPASLPPLRKRSDGIPFDQRMAATRKLAVRFLLRGCGQNGLWTDFRIVNGPSDEWVSAVVGCALAGTADDNTSGATRRLCSALLRRQRPGGGWSYNGSSPPDADSTAWVLRFLRATGYEGPSVERALAFLASHILTEGGIATYAGDTPIRFAYKRGDDGSIGWRGVHDCVAANAAAILGGSLYTHLKQSQRPDGSWRAYWWETDTLATALAAMSLAQAGGNGIHLSRALTWARQQCAGTQSAFDAAWISRLLSLGDRADRQAAKRLLSHLAADQLEDGGWPSTARMLFPVPAQSERAEEMQPFLDERRMFTTACVIIALNAFAAR